LSDPRRDDLAFRVYERVRDAVIEITGAPPAAAGSLRPSAYWSEELENIDYMIEASPLIVRKLRHHSFNLTGIRPYDYRTKDACAASSSRPGSPRCATSAATRCSCPSRPRSAASATTSADASSTSTR